MPTQYEVADQAQYPWSSLVYIEAEFSTGAVITGSGFLVGPNDVLTAAHVISDPVAGGATRIEITPAFDPDPLETPYGTVAAYQWDYFTDLTVDEAGAQFDIALLTLDRPLGDLTGWMGLDPTFVSGIVNISGYPAIYGYNLMNVVGTVSADPTYLTFDFNGQEIHPANSGGPIWYDGPTGPMAIGVVASGMYGADIAATYSTVLSWMGGNDSLIVDDDRYIFGGDGSDSFQTGAGDDWIAGRGGSDELLAGAGADSLAGGAGVDLVVGNAGADTLRGGAEGDTLRGGQDADDLLGGQGNDELVGGIGDDTLAGGQGNDTLTGADGADAFVFGALGAGVDVIDDFQAGVDKLHLGEAFADFGLLSVSGETLSYDGIAFATFTGGYTLDLNDFVGA